MTLTEKISGLGQKGGALRLDGDEVGPSTLVTANRLVMTGLGKRATTVWLGADSLNGFAFTGNDLVLQDLSIARAPDAGDGHALLVFPSTSSRLRVRLIRVHLQAQVLGMVVSAASPDVDLYLEDVDIDAGVTGLWLTGGSTGRHRRCVLEDCRVRSVRPVVSEWSGLRISDCQFDVSSAGLADTGDAHPGGVALLDGASDVRVTRSWFTGGSGAAVDLVATATTPPKTSAAHVGVHLSQLTASMPSVLALRSADERAMVHGLWLDLCSRMQATAVSGPGSFVDESEGVASSAGMARLSAAYDAAPVPALFSNHGRGFEVDGHHAAISTGRRQDPLRAGGNLLVDTRMAFLGTRWAAVGAPEVTVSPVAALDGVPGDPVLGKVDLVSVQKLAGHKLLVQAVADAPVEPAVLSVYARLGSDVGAAWIRLRVLAGDTSIGDTLVSFPVQAYWQRFSCVASPLPSADSMCVVVIEFSASESVPAGQRPTVLLWAPQFEVGTEPTAFQPREGNDSVAQTVFPRQVQAMMLGPTVFGYSPADPLVAPKSARRGDRFLNTDPKGSVDDTEAWIVTGSGAGGVTPLSPMAGVGVDQCGVNESQKTSPLLAFVLQQMAGSASPDPGDVRTRSARPSYRSDSTSLSQASRRSG